MQKYNVLCKNIEGEWKQIYRGENSYACKKHDLADGDE